MMGIDNLTTTSYEHERKDTLKLSSVAQQMENINRWNEQYNLGLKPFEQGIDTPEENANLREMTVVTPHIGSTHETFELLWQIIKDNYDGPVREAEAFGPNKDGLLLALDERMTDSDRVGKQGAYGDTFNYTGDTPVLDRPAHGVSVSEIDFLAHYDRTSAEGHPAPMHVRTSQNAPGVEVLAFLAHNPDYVKTMAPVSETSNPWLWVPGCQLHDRRGDVTARTPLIARLGDNNEATLSLAAVWNDGGDTHASIPTFTRPPAEITY